MRCDLCEIAHTPSRVGAHRGRKFRRGQVEGAGRQDRFERKLLEYVKKTGVLTHGAQAPRAENTWGAYGAKSAYGADNPTLAQQPHYSSMNFRSALVCGAPPVCPPPRSRSAPGLSVRPRSVRPRSVRPRSVRPRSVRPRSVLKLFRNMQALFWTRLDTLFFVTCEPGLSLFWTPLRAKATVILWVGGQRNTAN